MVRWGSRLLAAALVAFSAVTGGAAEPVKAPDAVLRDVQGTSLRLSDQQGKVVFLYFWSSRSPLCSQAVPAVEHLFENRKYRDVAVIGVTFERDRAAVLRFLDEAGVRHAVALGERPLADAYHVTGLPAFFIIDPEGTIVKRYNGYQAGMEKKWEQAIDSVMDMSVRVRPYHSERKP